MSKDKNTAASFHCEMVDKDFVRSMFKNHHAALPKRFEHYNRPMISVLVPEGKANEEKFSEFEAKAKSAHLMELKLITDEQHIHIVYYKAGKELIEKMESSGLIDSVRKDQLQREFEIERFRSPGDRSRMQ